MIIQKKNKTLIFYSKILRTNNQNLALKNYENKVIFIFLWCI